MRAVRNPQMKFGEVDIAAIEFDPKSRDDIPPILRGLQHICTTPELREVVFKILGQVIPTRIGRHLTEEEKREKALWPGATGDGTVEDSGARCVAPGTRH